MGQDLNDIRKQINDVDEQMANLFEKRMNLAKQVAEYKIENSLPIEDKVREALLIEKNSSLIENNEISFPDLLPPALYCIHAFYTHI